MLGLRRDSAFENSDLKDVDGWVYYKHVGWDESKRVEHIHDLVPEIWVELSDCLRDEWSTESVFSEREVRQKSHDDENGSNCGNIDPP